MGTIWRNRQRYQVITPEEILDLLHQNYDHDHFIQELTKKTSVHNINYDDEKHLAEIMISDSTNSYLIEIDYINKKVSMTNVSLP